MDLFKKREMQTEEENANENANAKLYAPPYKEPEDVALYNIVRKLVDLGAEFDIKACGLHITNKSNE